MLSILNPEAHKRKPGIRDRGGYQFWRSWLDARPVRRGSRVQVPSPEVRFFRGSRTQENCKTYFYNTNLENPAFQNQKKKATCFILRIAKYSTLTLPIKIPYYSWYAQYTSLTSKLSIIKMLIHLTTTLQRPLPKRGRTSIQRNSPRIFGKRSEIRTKSHFRGKESCISEEPSTA